MTTERAAAMDEGRLVDVTATIPKSLEEGDTDAAIAVARTLHPAELARVLACLGSEQRTLLLGRLDPDELASIVGYLEPRYRPGVFEGRSPAELSKLAVALPDDLAAGLVQSLPRADRPERLIRCPAERAHAARTRVKRPDSG